MNNFLDNMIFDCNLLPANSSPTDVIYIYDLYIAFI